MSPLTSSSFPSSSLHPLFILTIADNKVSKSFYLSVSPSLSSFWFVVFFRTILIISLSPSSPTPVVRRYKGLGLLWYWSCRPLHDCLAACYCVLRKLRPSMNKFALPGRRSTETSCIFTSHKIIIYSQNKNKIITRKKPLSTSCKKSFTVG